MLLTSGVLWEIEAPVVYGLFGDQAGKKLPSLSSITTFVQSVAAFNFLYYSSLWSVKLSLLLFFRRLHSKKRSQKIWWWFVVAVCVLTWAACVADFPWSCAVHSLISYIGILKNKIYRLDFADYAKEHCATMSAIEYQLDTFYANCAMDVVTDCLSESHDFYQDCVS